MTLPAVLRMGNDIARQFAHLPAAKAAWAIARHIETFWDPSMRRALVAHIATHDDDSLHPTLVDAADQLVDKPTRSEPDAQP